ncbi:zinc ABC transporter substrate-binding protein [Mycoplasmatota bacterium]|nr:zinc ABC transporter substrate-binding protein [Mycoplasmatota bacterium]
MKKLIIIMTLLLSISILNGCQDSEDDRLKVAVSIVPQAGFVEEIGGDLVNVTTVIPVGFSPENYEPGARQIIAINEVSVYFTIGVPAESANILPELRDINVVHLEDYVSERYEDRYFGETEEEHAEDDHDHSHFGRDPHIWLSIKRVILMVELMVDELSALDPDNERTYQANASDYIDKLNTLNSDIEDMFEDKTMKTFIVYHPSYGYFADEYQLTMLALEEDGKEPSINHLQELISFARDNGINKIYHQAEIDSEQVRTFTNDIDGESVMLNPLDDDYLKAMRDMAELIAEGLS